MRFHDCMYLLSGINTEDDSMFATINGKQILVVDKEDYLLVVEKISKDNNLSKKVITIKSTKDVYLFIDDISNNRYSSHTDLDLHMSNSSLCDMI